MPNNNYLIFSALRIDRHGAQNCFCAIRLDDQRFYHDAESTSSLADKIIKDYVSDSEKSGKKLTLEELEKHKQEGFALKYNPAFNRYDNGEFCFMLLKGLGDNIENWGIEDEFKKALDKLIAEGREKAAKLGLEKLSADIQITYEDGKPIVHPQCDLSPR